MARPKIIQHGERLNLYLPKRIKRRLCLMAYEARRSVSSLVTELVLMNDKRNN